MADPSRTSILVAAARALGSRDPDPGIRNPDSLADLLIGPAEKELIKDHPLSAALDRDYAEAIQDYQVLGLTLLMIVRTRFIDERLEHAVRNGASQAVILGAGFDSRAYRFRELLRNARIFEVDSPATQEYKRRRAETALGAAPSNLTYVPMDFNRDDPGGVLLGAGFRPGEKTFFAWEGVSMYLPEQAVRRTLRAIATQSAPGSTLVMDYASAAAVQMMNAYRDAPIVRNLGTWGEPWIFGVPDGREREFFQECGWDLDQQSGLFSPQSIRRYLTRRDGTVMGLAPGSARWSPPPGSTSYGAAASAVNTSWYALAELRVPERQML